MRNLQAIQPGTGMSSIVDQEFGLLAINQSSRRGVSFGHSENLEGSQRVDRMNQIDERAEADIKSSLDSDNSPPVPTTRKAAFIRQEFISSTFKISQSHNLLISRSPSPPTLEDDQRGSSSSRRDTLNTRRRLPIIQS